MMSLYQITNGLRSKDILETLTRGVHVKNAIIRASSVSAEANAQHLFSTRHHTCSSLRFRLYNHDHHSIRMFSSNSSSSSPSYTFGIFDSLSKKLAGRTEEKKAEKTRDMLSQMADLSVWNLTAFSNNIEESLSDWRSKIPGLSSTKEIKAAKEAKKMLDCFKEILGNEATLDDLLGLSRKEMVCVVPIMRNCNNLLSYAYWD